MGTCYHYKEMYVNCNNKVIITLEGGNVTQDLYQLLHWSYTIIVKEWLHKIYSNCHNKVIIILQGGDVTYDVNFNIGNMLPLQGNVTYDVCQL